MQLYPQSMAHTSRVSAIGKASTPMLRGVVSTIALECELLNPLGYLSEGVYKRVWRQHFTAAGLAVRGIHWLEAPVLYRINFSWRESKRRAPTCFISLVALACCRVHQWVLEVFWVPTNQQQRLDFTHTLPLDQRIEAMKIAEQEHSKILERLKVVEGLQNGRNKTTEFMNMLPLSLKVYMSTRSKWMLEIEISDPDSTQKLPRCWTTGAFLGLLTT